MNARARPMKAMRYDPKNLLTSLVLVFPLFLIYQVGVLFTLPVLNGADFLTVFLFRNLGLSATAYLAYTVAVAVAFAIAVAVLRRKQHFDPKLIVPVLVESAIYALTMGSLIVFVMIKVLHVSPRLAGGMITEQGLGTRFVMSLGAGVWEETVFRLGIMTGVAVLLERVLGLGRWVAVAVALAVSAVLFSAMHHIPPYGDALHVGVFVFRVLAGCFFGLVYWFRGFAIAVYTHALYDVYVLLVR
jgi:membrane protease YdiL (CAAX protease family)